MKLEVVPGSLTEKQHRSDYRGRGHRNEQHRQTSRFVSLGESLNGRFRTYRSRN